MPWPFASKKRRAAAEQAASGAHHSKALAVVVDYLERCPRPSVLDLGPSSNETLSFLGRRGAELVVADLFRSCTHDGTGGLAYRSAAELPLPEGGEQFDVLLVWDLLHYVAPGERRAMGARLRRLARPDAHVFLVASWAAPIPPSPVHYRLVGRDRLAWQVPEGRRLPPPKLVPREIEKILPDFVTDRAVQLQNGLQEVVLRRVEPVVEEPPLAPPDGAD